MNPIVQSTMQLIGASQDMPTSTAIQSLGLDNIVQGIIKQEVSSPSGVVNNPGNVIYVGQTGATGSGKYFTGSDGKQYQYASFDTPQDGNLAVANLVQNAASKGQNLSDFIASYKGVSNSSPNTFTDPGTGGKQLPTLQSVVSNVVGTAIPAVATVVGSLLGGSSNTPQTNSSTPDSPAMKSLPEATTDSSSPVQQIVKQAGASTAILPQNENVDSADETSKSFGIPSDKVYALKKLLSSFFSGNSQANNNMATPQGLLPSLAQTPKQS